MSSLLKKSNLLKQFSKCLAWNTTRVSQYNGYNRLTLYNQSRFCSNQGKLQNEKENKQDINSQNSGGIDEQNKSPNDNESSDTNKNVNMEEEIKQRNANAPINQQILTEGYSEEHIPEPPPGGRTLFRDAIFGAFTAMMAGAAYTIYSTKKESYDDKTLNEVNTVRAHITHAVNASSPESRLYHLQQAELHCRKALEKLGGGYLAINESNSADMNEIDKIGTDAAPKNTDNVQVLTDEEYETETGVTSMKGIIATHSRSGQKVKKKLEKERKSKLNDIIEYDAGIVALHLQLGRISYMLRKYQSAIDNFLVVLKALSQEFGYQSNELIMPCRQISECYMHLSQYTMSKLFLERALAILDNGGNNGNSDAQYGPICEQMAVLLRKQGEWDESVLYSKKAYEGGKTILGENHLQMAHILLGRACAELELKNLIDCEMACRNALKIVDFQASNSNNNNNMNEIGATRIINDKMIKKEKEDGSKFKQMKDKVFGTAGIDIENNLESMEEAKMRQINSKINQASQIIDSENHEIIDLKCGILFVYGQCLIEQLRHEEAMMILTNALNYAQKLNDQTKLLLVYDQIRDLKNLKQKQH